VAYAVADALAGPVALSFPSRRRAVAANLRRIAAAARSPAPPTPRRVFASYNRFFFEYLRLAGTLDPARFPRIAIEGEERLRAALAIGRGAILVTAHVGNWEAGALELARRGFHLRVVTGMQFHPRFTARARAWKERLGIEVSAGGEGFRPLLRTLAANGVVGLTVDGDVFGEAGTFSWLGIPTRLPTGPARLSLLAGAPVLPACIAREGAWRFRIRIADPLPASLGPPRGARRAAPEATAALAGEIYDAVGAFVASHLDQWCLFRPLWPERPTPAGREVA
jgi:KDO2-lipid IV(A) lauroyltransferase